MQKIVVADVSVTTGAGEKGPWTLTQITDEKGAKYSTFDTALSHIMKGTVLEIEPEVKGKYINIKNYKIIQEAEVPKQSGDSRTESIETQVAIKLIFEAYLKMMELISVKGGSIDVRLTNLFSRALDWCDQRIPAGKASGNGKIPETEAKPPESHPSASDEPISVEHFENRGQLLTKCQNVHGVGPKGVCEILVIKDIKEIIDLDEAYRAIKRAVEK